MKKLSFLEKDSAAMILKIILVNILLGRSLGGFNSRSSTWRNYLQDDFSGNKWRGQYSNDYLSSRSSMDYPKLETEEFTGETPPRNQILVDDRTAKWSPTGMSDWGNYMLNDLRGRKWRGIRKQYTNDFLSGAEGLEHRDKISVKQKVETEKALTVKPQRNQIVTVKPATREQMHQEKSKWTSIGTSNRRNSALNGLGRIEWRGVGKQYTNDLISGIEPKLETKPALTAKPEQRSQMHIDNDSTKWSPIGSFNWTNYVYNGLGGSKWRKLGKNYFLYNTGSKKNQVLTTRKLESSTVVAIATKKNIKNTVTDKTTIKPKRNDQKTSRKLQYSTIRDTVATQPSSEVRVQITSTTSVTQTVSATTAVNNNTQENDTISDTITSSGESGEKENSTTSQTTDMLSGDMVSEGNNEQENSTTSQPSDNSVLEIDSVTTPGEGGGQENSTASQTSDMLSGEATSTASPEGSDEQGTSISSQTTDSSIKELESVSSTGVDGGQETSPNPQTTGTLSGESTVSPVEESAIVNKEYDSSQLSYPTYG